MLKIIRTDRGTYATQVCCDVCGELILDRPMAVAVRSETGPAWHLHKGACHDTADAINERSPDGWMTLEEHLRQAWWNAGIESPGANGKAIDRATD